LKAIAQRGALDVDPRRSCSERSSTLTTPVDLVGEVVARGGQLAAALEAAAMPVTQRASG